MYLIITYLFLLYVLYNVRLDLFQRLILIIKDCEQHLYLIIRKAGRVNYLVEANLINKNLYLLSIFVVPCRLINLYNFLQYYIKGLNIRSPFIRFYKYKVFFSLSYYIIILNYTWYGCSKCYGGQKYPAQWLFG